MAGRRFLAVSVLLAGSVLAGGSISAQDPCPDRDEDGYADCTPIGCDSSGLQCGDCDDEDGSVRPAADDTCNHRDDDCDGTVDETFPAVDLSRTILMPGIQIHSDFGWSIARVGDMDGDGLEDFAAGAPDLGSYGAVFVFSAADGSAICELEHEGARDRGMSIAVVGDIDRDLVPDIAVGGNGVFIFSGADCSFIDLYLDPEGGTGTGHALARLDDIDDDGIPDIVATVFGSRRLVIFSGADGSVIDRMTDPDAVFGEDFGHSLVTIDDLNDDGFPEIVAGIPGEDRGGAQTAGRVVIFSGADRSILRRLHGPDAQPSRFGYSLAALDDLNGDDIPDLAVGAPNRGSGNSGAAYVFSGADGALVGPMIDPAPTTGRRFGYSVAALGNRTVGVGAGGSTFAQVLIYSGGLALKRLVGSPSWTSGVHAIVELEDINGDGVPEIVGGAPDENTEEGDATGSVTIFLVESDCDGDRFAPSGGDCNDDDSEIHEQAPEACDGIDNDCDLLIDEDTDHDGFAVCDDCRPFDRHVYPGAPERCNGEDDDCDGLVDEGPDGDGDGFTTACDCDDGSSAVRPGVEDVCNRTDDDCDGTVDEGAGLVEALERVGDPDGVIRERFGWALDEVGDVNGDGFSDFVAGAPEWEIEGSPAGAGTAVLVSGATREPICRMTDGEGRHWDRMGSGVAGIGDVDGNGIPDIVVASRRAALIFSGTNCSLIDAVTEGSTLQGRVPPAGWPVAAVGDLDGDGVQEVAAYSDRFSAVVFSGATREILFYLTHPSVAFGDEFAHSLGGVDDVSGDGVPDILVGSPGDVTATNLGSVSVFSGADGTLIRKLVIPGDPIHDRDRLGSSVLGLPDVSGDGVPDIAAGAPEASNEDGHLTDIGAITIFSGRDGSIVRTLVDPSPERGQRLGHALAVFRDITHDGIPEILVSAEGEQARHRPQVLLFDVTTGSLLRRLWSPDGNRDSWARDIAVLGDVNGDGSEEILIGAPWGLAPDEEFSGWVAMVILEADCDRDGQGRSGTDCDDTDPDRHVGAPERCNGEDDDCDGEIDEDTDGDTFAACDECDNGSPLIYPGAPERCNGRDDDCDGEIDDGDDLDGDGHATPCDCDDGAAAVNAEAAEICNQRDDDCDNLVDEGSNPEITMQSVPAPLNDDISFAADVVPVGDLDGDGVSEVAVGAPSADTEQASGRGVVWVYSGSTLETHCMLQPGDSEAGERFGESLAAAGDATGDGVPDIFVGAPGRGNSGDRNVGSVVLFSGVDCNEVWRIVDARSRHDDEIGTAMAARDLTGDGLADVLAVGGGRIRLYDRFRGIASKVFAEDGLFIETVAVIDDVNADGVPDVLGGAPEDGRFSTKAGSVTVFSGADGRIIRTLLDPEIPNANHLVGHSVVAIDDVTGDDVQDVVVGAPGFSSASEGRVLIFSGADGALVARMTDPMGSGSAQVGYSVDALPDVTGDGVPDVLVGSRGSPASHVLVFSGANGQVVRRFDDPAVTDWWQMVVANVGDLSGDGVPEIAAGTRRSETGHGRLSWFSIESDCDADTFTPFEGDCDDRNAAAHPDVEDLCGDGIDLDCIPGDGTSETWYGTSCDGADRDQCADGIIACLDGVQGCNDSSAHSAEVCSGLDDDCNGTVDDPVCADYDVDGDGRLGGVELSWIGRAFTLCSANPGLEWWARADLDGDGCIDGNDLAVLANLWARTCSGSNVTCD